MISSENENKEFVFENEKELKVEELLTSSNTNFDFNELDTTRNNRATKPKNLTKKQRRTHTKMVKSSRRRNRR